MDILSCNTGYFLGYTGLLRDYMLHPLRSVIGTSAEDNRLERFVQLVADVDPELVVLQEVDQGSLRTRTEGQVQRIASYFDRFSARSAVKYGDSVVAKLPLFRHMGNGVLHEDAAVTEHFLEHGGKSLVHEIEVDGIQVFSIHLARFGAGIRRRQLQELAEIVDTESALIIGDFNAFNGRTEVDILQQRLGFEIAAVGDTFPAIAPSYPLDFAMHAPDLSVTCRRLEQSVSDHLPVVVSIS